jgi:ribosomal protein S18 acetylase RimI-like enzyme
MIEFKKLEDDDILEKRLTPFFKSVPFGRFILDHTLDRANSITLELENIKSFLKKGEVWVALKDSVVTGLIGFQYADWDSKHFGLKIGKINYFLVSDSEEEKISIAKGLMKEFNSWVANNEIKLVIAKIDTIHFCPNLALQQENFIFYECITHRTLKDLNIASDTKYRYAIESDRENLIAVFNDSTFKKSHFYLDEKLDKKKIDEMYDKWIANAFTSVSEILIVEEEGQIAGVCMFSVKDYQEQFGKTIATWEFAAISQDFRGRGLGNRLYEATISDCHKKGADLLDATLVAKNILSQRILNNYKFELMNSYFTFHKWYE